MANQILLTDNLADNVTFTISRNPSKDNLGSIYNDPSVFTVFFHSSYYLNKIGIFDGYCIQPWIAIGDNKYAADIYYSTEDFSILTKVDLNQDSVADETFELTDEKVQPVSFVLNNLSWEQLDADAALEGVIRDDNDNILNPTDASGNYIYLEIADVQYLIWDLIYDFYAPDYAGSPVFNETDYGVRALNTTTNAILKNNVVPHAENYIANEGGDKVGIIIKPDLNKQYIITTIKKSDIPDYMVTISGDKIAQRKSEKLTLYFKVGRVTPAGLFQIIFDDDTGEVKLHFPQIVPRKKATGKGKCGLDKGYTEAFTDSNQVSYGDGIGKVMTNSVKKRHSRGKGRNKLYQIATKKKKSLMFKCNLTKKRHNRHENRKKQTLNTMIRAGVNDFYDNYNHAITEDLSFTIKNKRQASSLNRRLSEWCKGTLQKALEEISYHRSSSVTVVNAAYTSQVDSRHGVLLGTREGEQFFTFDGEVLQADGNAARNIEARLDDAEISRHTKSVEVRKVLIKRTVAFLRSRDMTIDDAINQGWFNPRHLKGICKKGMGLE